MHFSISLFLFFILVTSISAQSVIQVHIISRHGSRELLPKTPLLQENPRDVPLTTIGVIEAYTEGLWLNSRYINPLSPDALPNITTYNVNQVSFVSTTFFRTLETSYSLTRGLYPASGFQNVQQINSTSGQALSIFSTNSSDDIMLRPYDNCPSYLNDLSAWYTTNQFQNQQQQYAAKIAAIQAAAGSFYSSSITLKNFWNFFDFYFVHFTEYPNTIPAALLALDADIKTIVNWLESYTYGSVLTKGVLGATYLNYVSKNMLLSSVSSVDLRNISPSLFYYSAHYANLLVSFSTLLLDQDYPNLLQSIPVYTALFVIELRTHPTINGQYIVTFLFKNGVDDLTGTVLQLTTLLNNYGKKAGPQQYLLLSDFSAALNDRVNQAGVPDVKSWCKVCNNVQSDVCMPYAIESSIAAYQQTLSNSQSLSYSPSVYWGSVWGMFVCGILLTIGSQRMCNRKLFLTAEQKKLLKKEEKNSEIETTPKASTNHNMANATRVVI